MEEPEGDPGQPDTTEDTVAFGQREDVIAQAPGWEKAFMARRADGIRRAQRISLALSATPDAEQARAKEKRLDELLGLFETKYRTDRVKHEDPDGYATWALKTTWKRATDGESYYENTPQPSRHRILSWQLQKDDDAEELKPSDVYFLQYYRGAGTQNNPLPPLGCLRQQQAYSELTQPIYDYLRLINPDQDGSVQPQDYLVGSNAYYAFLGSPNGSPVAYLVIDWARELGITSLRSIRIDNSLNLYFNFLTTGTAATAWAT